MSLPINSDLDFLSVSHLRNVLLDTLASDQGAPVQGQFWFNTGTKLFKLYDGVSTQVIPTLAAVLATRLDQFATPTVPFSMGGQKLTNLGAPTVAGDAATWDYVNSVLQGYDWKPSVRAATIAAGNITVAGGAPSTLDGVTLAVNDRILVKNQTTPAENGIYYISSLGAGANGTWLRATDADVSAKVTSGMTVFVEQGTANAGTVWSLTTSGVIVLGTTGLAFTQTGGGNTYTGASNGGGQAIYTGMSGNVLQYNTITVANASSTALSIATASNLITVTFTPSNLDINGLGGSALTMAHGGTGAAIAATQYGLPYFATTTTMGSTSAGTATGVLHGNASGAPTWGPVALGAEVSGTLPLARGGTGVSGSSMDIPAVYKVPVRGACNTDISIAAPGATPGANGVVPGDRLLLCGQSIASQNGIWVWQGAAVPMTRPTDYASGSTVQAYYGVTVKVGGGPLVGFEFFLNTIGVITIDTTGVAFSTLLTNVGSAFGTLGVSYGGTGGGDASTARTNLGAVGKYAINNTLGTSQVVIHSLNTTDVQIQVFELTGAKRELFCEKQITSANTVTLLWGSSQAAGTLRIIVMG